MTVMEDLLSQADEQDSAHQETTRAANGEPVPRIRPDERDPSTARRSRLTDKPIGVFIRARRLQGATDRSVLEFADRSLAARPRGWRRGHGQFPHEVDEFMHISRRMRIIALQCASHGAERHRHGLRSHFSSQAGERRHQPRKSSTFWLCGTRCGPPFLQE